MSKRDVVFFHKHKFVEITRRFVILTQSTAEFVIKMTRLHMRKRRQAFDENDMLSYFTLNDMNFQARDRFKGKLCLNVKVHFVLDSNTIYSYFRIKNDSPLWEEEDSKLFNGNDMSILFHLKRHEFSRRRLKY